MSLKGRVQYVFANNVALTCEQTRIRVLAFSTESYDECLLRFVGR